MAYSVASDVKSFRVCYRFRIVRTVLYSGLFARSLAMGMRSTNNSIKQLLFIELTARKMVQMPVRLQIVARSRACLLRLVLKLLLEMKEFRRLLRLSSPEQYKLRQPPNERVNVLHKLRLISQVLLWPRPQIHRFLQQIRRVRVLGAFRHPFRHC